LVSSDKNERFFDGALKNNSFLEYPVLDTYREVFKNDVFNLDIQIPEVNQETDKTTVIIPTLNEETTSKT
jgi:hypothetical protein